MIFSTVFFIFIFFPIVFILFSIVKQEYKLSLLLLASIFFYYWGEQIFVFVIIASIALNFAFGLLVEFSKRKKFVLGLGIIANLLLIIYFKYSNFFVSNFLNRSFPGIHLPLGISFFTFQGISYLVDIYRKDIYADRNFLRFSFYISFFPQLIAGPIVRYSEVLHSLSRLRSSYEETISGLQLFSIGLAKKVIIANTLGIYVDEVLSGHTNSFGSIVTWFAILSYSFQIYFDFSGYSDMAIGLGRIFGLTFPKNFNFPYSSLSVQDFWRRWHISLSAWFRDYLYIPLGGNRVGFTRQNLNLIVVFICCGFWHGASWNFLIWGLYHGFFLVLERTKYQDVVTILPNFLRFLLNFTIINIGWVFFRIEDINDSFNCLAAMFGKNGFGMSEAISIFDIRWTLGILLAILFGFEWSFLKKLSENIVTSRLFAVSVFLISIIFLIANNYNPFIYFRF
ncbi:MBOAT family protein [Leptospira sp. 201903074]|uniref:MBOAT family O-acyltransferase n=1 Tax=Leptospira abararensis TaxID=2810036 RepID=UPI0019659D8F|nr:MBOAT family protein [Leptospira abararensis]MBM9547009.1 MBOAT family protein [Leptospira abararensis]